MLELLGAIGEKLGETAVPIQVRTMPARRCLLGFFGFLAPALWQITNWTE